MKTPAMPATIEAPMMAFARGNAADPPIASKLVSTINGLRRANTRVAISMTSVRLRRFDVELPKMQVATPNLSLLPVAWVGCVVDIGEFLGLLPVQHQIRCHFRLVGDRIK